MKKKIIFCIPSLVMGGVESALCELLSALSKTNLYELSVITFHANVSPQYMDFFHNINIKLHIEARNKYLPRFIGRLLQNKLANKVLLDQDVIVDFKYTESYRYYKHLDIPKICWLHCSYPHFKNNIEKSHMPSFNKVVCVSDALASSIKNEIPSLGNKCQFIYNAINEERIKTQSEEVLYRTSGRYFVAVQRLEGKEKDVATVINAFNLLTEKYADIKLYIVGDGEQDYKKYLLNLAKDNSNIVFTGALNNAAAIINNAEAVVLSSTSKVGEGLPMVLLEAQALRTVCISSNVESGPAEILMNGNAGFLFEPANPEALAKVMEQVLTDKQLCTQKVSCASEHLYRFTPEQAAKSFINLIEQI